MISRLILALALVIQGQSVLADGTIEVPSRAQFTKIEAKNDSGMWTPVEIPKVKKRKISLPAGEYRYAIKLRSASGTFRGTMQVTDGSHLYIHSAITPDNEKVHSWASRSVPRSEDFESEKLEVYCMATIGYGEKQEYMVDACMQLADIGNAKGLFGAGYLFEEGAGGAKRDRKKASEYYLQAYRLGFDEAGIRFVLLHQAETKGTEVLLEMASNGHEWAIGAASQLLSTSNNPEDKARSRDFAKQSLTLGNPIGFRTLSQLAFADQHDGIENVIEAAAWLNLYLMNVDKRPYGITGYASAIEVSLLADDLPAISKKTILLADEQINSGYYLLIDTSMLKAFEERGELSLTINDFFHLPVSRFDRVYAIELMVSEKYHNVALNIDGIYEESATFQIGLVEGSVACLSVESEPPTFRIATFSKDDRCPQSVDEATSMWEVMSQYL